MAKYHISPTTGQPNLCNAKVQCPYGGSEDHYDSKEAARAAFEAQSAASTFAPVRKKETGLATVTNLDSKRAEKAESREARLAEARTATNFDACYDAYPKYKLTTADKTMLTAVAAGKKVSDDKLDKFIEDRAMTTERNAFNTDQEVEAARGLLGYVKAVRAESSTPSTLPTLESFNPATHTLFSNKSALSSAPIMGKAIRRAHAHGEWMHELADQHRQAATYLTEQDETTPEQYLQSAKECERDATKAEAQVQAQLRELQYRFDNDEAFARTANADVKRMLQAGHFRPKATSFDGVPIGTLRKVN